MPWDPGCGPLVFSNWERYAPSRNMRAREGFPAEVIFELGPQAHQMKRGRGIPGGRHGVGVGKMHGGRGEEEEEGRELVHSSLGDPGPGVLGGRLLNPGGDKGHRPH